jgi:hypothetical protein
VYIDKTLDVLELELKSADSTNRFVKLMVQIQIRYLAHFLRVYTDRKTTKTKIY